MYLSFFKLRHDPFKISPDPHFLWSGEKQKTTLKTLRGAINDQKGFLHLTGDVGTGKTTLVNALVDSLESDVLIGKINDPKMESMDLMNYISHVFHMNKIFESKEYFGIHFNHFLHSTSTNGRKILLIIDEAQRCDPGLLNDLIVFPIEFQNTRSFNILFVGHNDGKDIFSSAENNSLSGQISIRCQLEHLDLSETRELIQFRLRTAGAQRQIFSEDALAAVYTFSSGIPRKIVIICDQALLTCYTLGKERVTGSMVRRCAQKHHLPFDHKKEKSISLN